MIPQWVFLGRQAAAPRREFGRRRAWLAACAALVGLHFVARGVPPIHAGVKQVEIRLVHPAATSPIQGRLFVFFSRQKLPEPRMGPNWFRPEPFFGHDVEKFERGQTRVIDQAADGYPDPLANLPPGRYFTQAVLHHAFDSPFPGQGVGNFHSRVAELTIGGDDQSLLLELDQVIEAAQFPTTAWRREVVVQSKLLSAFHRRDVTERATVILPAGYDANPERRFGVIYTIPGFGGSHWDATRIPQPPQAAEGEEEFIRVYLSGRCHWGHHVFADSATNGPRGQALVTELIPRIDHDFRTVAAPHGRFVTGHSSGGWSSLWVQVSYPETFGGVWSTSPDPVDFRDYQQANLYADPPQNMFRDVAGQRRPIARRGTMPVLWYDSFTRMDDVLARGGQLRSFEAVFSPLDERGEPRRMYDRDSGLIDPKVAKAWESYDIRLKIERDWKRLEPLLRGKLHIVMGSRDTFYLEGAVVQLAESLKQLGSDAKVEIVPDADHSNVLTAQLLARIRQEMSAAFRKGAP